MQEKIIGETTIKDILSKNPDITETNLLEKLKIEKLEAEHCLQILEADPHIISIFPIPFEESDGTRYTPDNPFELPEDFSVKFLGETAQEEIEKLLEYLGLSGIQDLFINYIERRDWKKNVIGPQFPSVYEFLRNSNPVGHNTLTLRIIAPIIFLQEYAQRRGHDKLAKQLDEFFENILRRELDAFTSSMSKLEDKVQEGVQEKIKEKVLPTPKVVKDVKEKLGERTAIEYLVKSMKETVLQIFPIIYNYQKSLKTQ